MRPRYSTMSFFNSSKKMLSKKDVLKIINLYLNFTPMIIIQFEILEIYGTMRLSIWIVKISKIMEWVQFHVALKSQPNSGDKTVFPPSNII